jgi:PAS domain S-box-containing protein
MIEAQSLPIPVLVYDAAGTVVAANPSACRLLGQKEAELLGSSAESAGWIVLKREGSSALETHPVTTVLRTGKPVHGAVVSVARPDGSEIWVQVDAWPAPSEPGPVTRVTLALTDVSSLLLGGPLTAAADDQLFSEVTQQFISVRLDPVAILTTLVKTLSKLRSGTWVGVLLDRDPSTMRVVSANESEPELLHFVDEYMAVRRESGQVETSGLTQQVIETGHAMLAPSATWNEFVEMMSPQASEWLSRLQYEPAKEWRHLGVLFVPIRSRGSTFGTLGVVDTRASYPLTERDREWLQGVADRAAVAIENAQLYADAVSRLERLSALRSVGLAIGASQDLRLTLQVILDHLIKNLGVDAADVLLVDEADGMLATAASSGFHSVSMPDYRLPVDQELPGRVMTGRRIETVTALGAFSQFRRRSLFAREGFKAYGAVPLIARGKLSGVLEVFHRSPLDPDQEWIGFLDALASDAALAIDNAAMFEKLRTAGPGLAAVRARQPAPNLSQVEKSVLALVIEGYPNREIAARLHLSQNTIKFHVRQVLQKVGATNRTELARKATQEGWL